MSDLCREQGDMNIPIFVAVKRASMQPVLSLVHDTRAADVGALNYGNSNHLMQ